MIDCRNVPTAAMGIHVLTLQNAEMSNAIGVIGVYTVVVGVIIEADSRWLGESGLGRLCCYTFVGYAKS